MNISLAGPSTGSNAGRGFRYQDKVGALFGARMLTGNGGFIAIVPEGSDDFELREAGAGIVLVDTKATRPGSRVRSRSEDAASLRTLWSRPLRQDAPVNEFWIVSERGREDFADGKTPAKDLFQPKDLAKAERSFLVLEPDPIAAASALLIEDRKLSPLAADLVVLALAQHMGDLASSNGALALDERKALTVTDAERITSRVLAAVDAGRLEQIIRSGFLAPVDFATPIDDPAFYLGVDVEPGHFTAGLALSRPEAAARVLSGFDKTRVVVVTGPSGAGKSGLMWNAVREARLGRRWFRVNGPSAPDAEAITAFFQAYSGVPIGFVLDDIGRGRLEVWNAMRSWIAAQPQVIMLGSMRAEDVSLLAARHSISEVAVSSDPRLAEMLWRRMRERQQTAWEGWSEPWGRSTGLLLEYGHILTQGERLDAVIRDQIRTRLSEHRDHELAILSASAPASIQGGAVLIEKLRAHLGLSASDLARSLERLIEEHLVRLDASRTRLTGLHALRASSICAALSEVGHSTPAEQAIMAISVVAPESLEVCVSGFIASGAITETSAGAALAERLATSPILSEMANALRGMRGGALTLIARQWTADSLARGMPPKVATLAALLGATDPQLLPEINNLRSLAQQGHELLATAAARQPEPQLVDAVVTALSTQTASPAAADIVDGLSVLANVALTSSHLSALKSARPPFEEYLISDVVGILDAAEAIDAGLAAAWASSSAATNAPTLFTRLVTETPFALEPVHEDTAEGLIVHADIYEAALEPDENPNDRLFAYAKAILHVEPSAQSAHVRLVDATGTKTLHLDAEKRIRRGTAPPDALASSNRRIIDAVARAVGGESWSNYLARGEDLLTRGHQAFQRLLDNATVGRVDQGALDTLNEIVEACGSLLAPATPVDQSDVSHTGRHLTPLQDLTFNLNGRLVLDLSKLPEGGSRLASHARDLLNRAEEARAEPWLLIRDKAPPVLSDVEKTLNDIEVVALESAASNQNPSRRWPKANGKPKDAFSFVVRGSRLSFTQRIEVRRRELEVAVERELSGAKLLAPTLDDGNLWASKFVASFPIATFEELKGWILSARQIGDRISTQMNEREDISLVPLLNGHAAIEYAYQVSRGRPHSIVGQVLNASGQTSLLAPPDQKLVQRLRVPVIIHPPELARVALAIRDVAAMMQLGLGHEDRPLAEQEHLKNAISDLQAYRSEVFALFDSIDNPTIRAMEALAEALAKGDTSGANIDGSFSQDSLNEALAELTWQRALAAS